jgi:hypothetical protein
MPIIGSAPNKSFQRTDGTRTGAEVWQEAKAAAVKVKSADHDTHDEDVGDAISACLFKDGSNLNADIPMNTNKFTGVENAAARDQFAAAGQVQDSSLTYVSAAGTGDAITLDLTPSITAYAAGQIFHFKATATNTGAATINVDAVGAKDLKKGAAGSTALAAGDITSGGMYVVMYDGTNMQLLNPGTQNIDVQPLDELLTEIAALSTDPNADSGLFFDDSAGAMAYWTPTGALSFSGTNLAVASAADGNVGVIELAVQSEMETGTDTDRAVVPGRQHFHPSAAKLWGGVDYSGGTPSIGSSRNITSITDTGTGSLSVTIATDFSGADYGLLISGERAAANVCVFDSDSRGAGSFSCIVNNSATGNAVDPVYVSFSAFGDLA